MDGLSKEQGRASGGQRQLAHAARIGLKALDFLALEDENPLMIAQELADTLFELYRPGGAHSLQIERRIPAKHKREACPRSQFQVRKDLPNGGIDRLPITGVGD